MKNILKVLSLILFIAFSFAVCGCQEATESITEPFLKTSDSITLKDCSIKTQSCSYKITPNGFELDRLSKKGYYMTITVYYTVTYEKDLDWWLGITYAGAPGYEVSILDENLQGTMKNDIEAPSKKTERSISITVPTTEIYGNTYTFSVSSDNWQNIIYFSNMRVEYYCRK